MKKGLLENLSPLFSSSFVKQGEGIGGKKEEAVDGSFGAGLGEGKKT